MDTQKVDKKKCSHCGKELDLDMFYKNKCAHDGLTNECRICVKARTKLARENFSYRVDYYENKVNNICTDFNMVSQKPEFKLDSWSINIKSLQNCEISLQIPLPKNIKIIDAEYLLNIALSKITILNNINGELKILLGTPIIYITGIIIRGE